MYFLNFDFCQLLGCLLFPYGPKMFEIVDFGTIAFVFVLIHVFNAVDQIYEIL